MGAEAVCEDLDGANMGAVVGIWWLIVTLVAVKPVQKSIIGEPVDQGEKEPDCHDAETHGADGGESGGVAAVDEVEHEDSDEEGVPEKAAKCAGCVGDGRSIQAERARVSRGACGAAPEVRRIEDGGRVSPCSRTSPRIPPGRRAARRCG